MTPQLNRMLYKKFFRERNIIFIILVLSIVLRLYGSNTIPLVNDEYEQIEASRLISFSPSNLNLPVESEITKHPLLVAYLIKIGTYILAIKRLGHNIIVVRSFFVLLASAGILFIYLLVREFQDKKRAILVLLLLCFSQFHIGISRLMLSMNGLLFFNALALYCFFKAINDSSGRFFYLFGITLGVGYLAKETIILLVPVFIFFIAIEPQYRHWLRRKEPYLALVLMILVILPTIYWNFSNNWINYRRHIEKASGFGFSLVSFTLYLGELFVYLSRRLNDNVLNRLCSYEYPFMHWPLGLICLTGVIYSFSLRRQKSGLLRFSLINFLFIFIHFSFIKIRGYLHFDDFWQASLSFFPALILTANMLIELGNRYKFVKAVVGSFIIYCFINSIIFINFPANCFIPRDSLKVKELFDTAAVYLKEGRKDKVLKVYDYIKKHYPKYVNLDTQY